jgi:transitional endoplasmic reticulum ATPase
MVVKNGPRSHVNVMWGRFLLPTGGYLQTSTVMSRNKLWEFKLVGMVLRRYQPVVQKIVEEMREILETNSIYRGKALKIKFRDEDSDLIPLPEPTFMDLRGVEPSDLIFSGATQRVIEASLFTPIERTNDVRDAGVTLSRGVLLVGHPGVGKTMTAHVAARKAAANGWTFVMAEATELEEALRFAEQYQPAVVFVEDIDRVTSGSRDAHLDRILGLLDGIDTKNNDLIVVFTANEISKIHAAVLRPGRLDAVVNITAPDADAVQRLLRLYGGNLISESEILTDAGIELEGQIPAVVAEVVKRAKLYAIAASEPGAILQITNHDLVEAARGMKMHRELLTPQEEDNRDPEVVAADVLGQHIREGLTNLNHDGAMTSSRIAR